MQDIMSKLQEILSTKEGQAQLNSIAGMLNSNQSTTPPPPPAKSEESPPPQNGGFDFSALASMFSQNSPPTQEQSTQPNIDMGMILNLQKMFSSVNTNDKNAQLLTALKPHFSEERQSKVDKAMSIMRLISMLPMLKDSGILSGIL